jgi:hypothetical protein
MERQDDGRNKRAANAPASWRVSSLRPLDEDGNTSPRKTLGRQDS